MRIHPHSKNMKILSVPVATPVFVHGYFVFFIHKHFHLKKCHLYGIMQSLMGLKKQEPVNTQIFFPVSASYNLLERHWRKLARKIPSARI